MSELLQCSEPVKQVIIARHTVFNEQASLTGEAAQRVVERGLRRDDYDDWPLLPEGVNQAGLLRQELAGVAIDACLCSPTLRTRQTAGIILEGRDVEIELMEELRERDRGMFSYMPDEWAENHPMYKIGKDSFLGWRPGGEDAVPRAETGQEVMERIDPAVLNRADALAPGGCVYIQTHSETMGTFRGVPRLGARNAARFAMPVIADHRDIPQLKKASWIGQVQLDMYERRSSGPEMTHFRTLGYHKGERFETDWLEIVRG